MSAQTKRERDSSGLLEAMRGVYSWDEIANVIGVKTGTEAILIYRQAIRKMQYYLIGKTELREDLKDSMQMLFDQRASMEPAIFKGSINIKKVVRK